MVTIFFLQKKMEIAEKNKLMTQTSPNFGYF